MTIPSAFGSKVLSVREVPTSQLARTRSVEPEFICEVNLILPITSAVYHVSLQRCTPNFVGVNPDESG